MTMTEEFYLTKKSNTESYSGEINIEDFNTYTLNKKRINSYLDAKNFNSDCKKKKEIQKMYKGMTLEELREEKLISNTDGRPSPTLTDEKWQTELAIRKLSIEPYPSTIKKFGGQHSKCYEICNNGVYYTYSGKTNYQQYCSFMNDVLKNIRSGQVDYCYFIYQIVDLLKFHYTDLKTKYCDGYWEVWLDKY